MTAYKRLPLAILLILSHHALADDVPTVQLEHEIINIKRQPLESLALGGVRKVGDTVIKNEVLKQRAVTLGDALGGELGIHSNQFGGGASAPIIRGQEGKRIKILANNADVVDMSNMSPDHAISVDTQLAKQVELVRGATTLLYSSGNAAGVINVVDEKIPSQLPEQKIKTDLGLRFNTGSHEKLATVGTTIGLGDHLALRLESLHRHAGDYRTPDYQHPIYKLDANKKLTVTHESLDYLPESWAEGTVGTVGLSWIGDRGYVGASLTERREKYGLPAHSHAYEDCHADTVRQSLLLKGGKPFLKMYPFLAEEKDIDYDNIGLTCHNHDNTAVHEHEHTAPFIDLKSTRYEVRGQMSKPFAGIEKIRFNASRTNYRHDEIEGDSIEGFFKNSSHNARLEFAHQPIKGLTGVWGVQYANSKNSATTTPTCTPIWPSITCTPNVQHMLHNNKSDTLSWFGLEQLTWRDVTFELSGRAEKQKVTMQYDEEATTTYIDDIYYCGTGLKCQAYRPDGTYGVMTANEAQAYVRDLLKPHKETAYSYSFSTNWQFKPNYTLSLNLSHQERVPNAQELYAHGMHLATNSFEIGNRNLTKEKSNNFEIGLAYQGDKLDYKFSTYLYDFDNYIYLLAMNDGRGPRSIKNDAELKVNRYMQSPARFYGLEANIGYQFTPVYHASLFGDFVHGKLINMPDVIDEYRPARTFFERNYPEEITYKPQADRYTPRLPPMRLGARLKADFDDRWSGDVEYVHTFKQDKLSKFESETAGNHMLNLGLNYQHYKGVVDYSIFFKANNLLNQQVYAHETFLPYIPQMGRNFSMGINFKF